MTSRPLSRAVDIADLLLPLDEASAVPLYRQIYEGVRNAIVEGRLPPGARLPSTRRLAEYLDVSRTTVLVTFEQLVAEGFLDAAVGSGSRVASHVAPPRSVTRAWSAAAVKPATNVSDRCRLAVGVPRPARPRTPVLEHSAPDSPPWTSFRSTCGAGSPPAADAGSRCATSFMEPRRGSPSFGMPLSRSLSRAASAASAPA